MTPTQIANLALSQVPADPITNISDITTLRSRECNRWYGQVVTEVIERTGPVWNTKRVALSALANNDRETEWGYAYALPSDMAFPVKLLDGLSGVPNHYEFSGSTIYANVPEAVIEYASTVDLANERCALFRAAVIAQLAARIVMPITKQRKQALELQNAAENAIERAAAFSYNLKQVTYGDHIPDSIKARTGELFPVGRREPPEATYPDFDPVGTFESELD